MMGQRNLITDIEGILVGNAQDTDLKSGVTVLTSDVPMTASVHVMGGAPGTRETDLLAPDKTVGSVDALVLAGGSAFGLAAADGVVSALREKGRGFDASGHPVPIVPAAILFDLAAGGKHVWDQNPYPALGREAFSNASIDFAIGSSGAGTGATTASLKGGLGSASVLVPGGITVGALVAANPVGDVVGPEGPEFWASPFEIDAEFGGLSGVKQAGEPRTKLDPQTATTIAIVATNATLSKAGCHRLAVAAHDGLARAIVPSHTPFDGDLVFAVSTRAGPEPSHGDMAHLCHAASTTLARAIARAIYSASPSPHDLKPCWRQKFGD